MATSRTSRTSNDQPRPSPSGAAPGEARTIGTSVVTRIVARGLDGVTKGSPSFERSNGRRPAHPGDPAVQREGPAGPREQPVRACEIGGEGGRVLDPDGRRQPVPEDAAEWHEQRLVVDRHAHRPLVDGGAGDREAAETGRDRVQLEAVDPGPGIVPDLDDRRHVEGPAADDDAQVHVIGRRQGEAGPVDGPGHDRRARRRLGAGRRRPPGRLGFGSRGRGGTRRGRRCERRGARPRCTRRDDDGEQGGRDGGGAGGHDPDRRTPRRPAP